jgi:hypothetical protein
MKTVGWFCPISTKFGNVLTRTAANLLTANFHEPPLRSKKTPLCTLSIERTSGHCLGTFRAGTFDSPVSLIYSSMFERFNTLLLNTTYSYSIADVLGYWRRRSDCYFVLFTTSLVVTTIACTMCALHFRVDSLSWLVL